MRPVPAHDTAPVLGLLDRLIDVLEDEQDAIRRLDVERLAEAVRGKDQLAEEFAASRTEVRALATCVDPSMIEVRERAVYARALAHANRILLDEVAAAIGARLGVPTEATGYDARGGRRSPRRLTPGVVVL